jgi:ribosomal protein S18 acetylase RimI-like enzyme
MLKLVKGYMMDRTMRLSFNKLAKETFSIDFEDWFQKGYWNDHYIPYSFFDGEKCIANASFNAMKLIMDGKVVQTGQIGTVMTHPEYRGRGLAQMLIEKILEDYSDQCDLFFLCAEEKASSLYKRCGFQYRQENNYLIDAGQYEKREHPLESLHLTPEQFMEIKRTSQPLSQKLSAVDDIHVAMFYYNLGFDKMIYEAETDVYAIYEIDGNTLYLYDVYSLNQVDLEKLIPQITPGFIEIIHCLFTPEDSVKGLEIKPGTSEWMQKALKNEIPEGYKIPEISKT